MDGSNSLLATLAQSCAAVTVRRTSPTPEEMSEMVSLYRSGLSLAKVGDRLGVHATTVLAQLRKVGVDTRTSHGDARV